jgi:TetR/AcrR family tetracycline transcriptional repressor
VAKIVREEVIAAALELLDEMGLEAVTTRRLAERLGVESPTLYWHFRDKAALLAEMAEAILAKHQTVETPRETGEWLTWFANNARSFRQALLATRDGARLHAGTTPCPDEVARVAPKVSYLVQVGFSKREALMALLTASEFTLGSVMEQQMHTNTQGSRAAPTAVPSRAASHVEALAATIGNILADERDAAFEFGLSLILEGLRHKLGAKPTRARSPRAKRANSSVK